MAMWRVVGALTIFALGVGAGVLSVNVLQSDKSYTVASSEVRQKNTQRSGLTNPLLECAELPEPFSIGERLTLEGEIETLITRRTQAGSISSAAVYFRDLNNGPWFGINEDKKFVPASLLKVPLAVSFFWRAETEEGLLNQTIEYEKGSANYEADQPYGPTHALEDKKVYSMRELISLMLKESSNEASLLLAQIDGIENIKKVYADFGQVTPEIGKDFLIDVHTYGSFFRVLYNATYLDRPASEEILKMLAESSFKEGLVAGVPSDVVVAHKFGTREVDGQKGTQQLHDCGIIYHPTTPYILCVMTQGNDFPELARFIKDVSSMVYASIKAGN